MADLFKNFPDDLDGLAREIRAGYAAKAKVDAAHTAALIAAQDTYTEATAAPRETYAKALGVWTSVDDRACEDRRNAEEEADRTHKTKTGDLYIEMGRLLIAAKAKVGTGGWQKWCNANALRPNGHPIDASEVRRMIKVAQDKDPAAARERQKEKNRAKVERHRLKAKNESVVTGDHVTTVEDSITYVPAGPPSGPKASTRLLPEQPGLVLDRFSADPAADFDHGPRPQPGVPKMGSMDPPGVTPPDRDLAMGRSGIGMFPPPDKAKVSDFSGSNQPAFAQALAEHQSATTLDQKTVADEAERWWDEFLRLIAARQTNSANRR